ncbi:MAG: tetratricopeptide repeat protein [Lewinella sp.]|nr:tetratricopeptide repeat protein [Lewinella sp.]
MFVKVTQKWGIIGLLFCTLTVGAQNRDSLLHAQTEATYQAALDLMANFQFDKAQTLLSECYIREPENKDFLLKIAYCNQQSGRYPDALIFYNKVLALDSLNTNALSSIGSIYERTSNYRQAAQYYHQLIQIDTSNAYYYKRNAYVALRLNKVLQGVIYFLRAHELNEADIETIDQLSNLYLTLNDLESAELMIRRGRNIDPNNVGLLYNQARLEQKRKNHEQVVEAIQKAMTQGDTSDYYQMMLGVAYIYLDSVDQAIEHLEAIVDRGKDSEYTHHYLGLAYRAKDENEKSIAHFEKAIELGISEKMADFQADLASVLVEQNDFRSAIEHYREALKYEPSAEHVFHLARACDQYYKDKKIALKYYEQYLNSKDQKFRTYTEQRIKQLKEFIHFSN